MITKRERMNRGYWDGRLAAELGWPYRYTASECAGDQCYLTGFQDGYEAFRQDRRLQLTH